MIEVECDNYHKKSHLKSSCPQRKRNEKNKKYHFKKEFVDVVVVSNNYKFARIQVAFMSDTQRS